jgi:diadenosine tetraphosphatase ApaH/serine/threonine PP2A family protein phosphatase
MRIALLSDVHGNLPAFEAVLADVDACAPDEIWCLGDLVGYGAEPDGCVALAAERCDVCLAGNHDQAVTGALDIAEFSKNAAEAAVWTREHIGAETLAFLERLPTSEVGGELGVWHASPRDPVWEYVMSYDLAAENMDHMEPRVGAVGHTHLALWFHRDGGPGEPDGEIAKAGLELELSEGQWLVNPGGVGQPRDGDPRAAWLLLDTEGWSAEWRRVEYPIDAAASAIVEAGLPKDLADRLYLGL